MADKLVNSTKLDACLDAEADAIRAKTGGSSPIPYDYANNKGFADAIAAIPTGGGITAQPLSVTQNGTYTAPSGTAYTPVTVSVPTGGSLPSVISKIDGGEFTFASNTASTYHIAHSLGVVPKGFVIWTDDVDISTAKNNIAIRGVFIVDESANGSVTSCLYQMGVYNNNFNNYTRTVGSNYSGYANANYISYNVSNTSYQAGANYKWLAWA